MESLLIDLAHSEGSDVLRLVGELDLAEANRAKRIAGTAIAAGTGPFVVDLSELTYCDSSGINVLVDIHRRAESCGRPVILRHPHPRVKRVLDLTAVSEQFVVDNDDPGARRCF